MTPRSDAHALHDLLVRVRASDGQHLQTAWAEVLEAEFGTHEFARRHAETVSLLTTTLNQIENMPNEAIRDRFRPYAHQWWMAVVGASWQWGGNMDSASILANEHLHLLGSAADIIETKLEETTASPGSFKLGPLRKQCEQWLGQLNTETDLSAALRLSLVQDLQHVLWLIENADMFGVARAARAGQGAVGGLALAGARLPEHRRDGWKVMLAELAGALLLLSGVFEAGTAAVESGAKFISEISSIVQGEVEDPPAISRTDDDGG